jgi:hypothetical protein
MVPFDHALQYQRIINETNLRQMIRYQVIPFEKIGRGKANLCYP